MRNIDSVININGEKLYVRLIEKNANRPILVFLHDSLGCITLWRDFPNKLAEATNCNLLIYDRKGYGQSEPVDNIRRTNRYLEEEADQLHHLLLQLNITNVILFGHSDGGSIALITAAKYPAVIKAVVSEAAHIFVEQETLDGINAAVISYSDTNLKERLAKYHGNKTDAVFQAWTDTWRSKEYRSWNIEHLLPRIVCPTLIIQGQADEYGTLKQVQGIAKGIGGPAHTFIIPGVGHTPHKEAPLETLEKTRQFIQTAVLTWQNQH
jgi:pimeloyl-ACP methyl ester carboxylesterase